MRRYMGLDFRWRSLWAGIKAGCLSAQCQGNLKVLFELLINEFFSYYLLSQSDLTEYFKDNKPEDIEQFLDLRGLQLLITKQKPYEFLMVVEQLRFQTRWNQTPRVPRTSVLGHSFFVAIFTLLLGYESGVEFCTKRFGKC